MLTLPRPTQTAPTPIGSVPPPPSIEHALPTLPLDPSFVTSPVPNFAQLHPHTLTWLWPGHIPCGSITLLDGPASCGKTRFLLDLAARVSSGQPMPDATTGLHTPVILITPNDPASILSHPSLALAHADLANIFSFNFVHNPPEPTTSDQPASSSPHASQQSPIDPSTHPFRFDPTDLDTLAREISRTHARLLIIDPLVTTLDALPSVSDRIIARVLNQLQQLVARLDIACILVRQCDPRQRSPRLTRAEKSPHLLTKSLTSFAILPDPLTPDHTLLIQTKQTFSIAAPALQFQLVPHPDNPALPRLLWHGPSDLSREDLDSMLAIRIPTLMPTRHHILRILQQHPEPQSIATLLQALPFLNYELLRKTLQRMTRDHQLLNPERGLYTLPANVSPPVVPDCSSHSSVPSTVSPLVVPGNLSHSSVPSAVSQSVVPDSLSRSSIRNDVSQPSIPENVSRVSVPETLSPSPALTSLPQPFVSDGLSQSSDPEIVPTHLILPPANHPSSQTPTSAVAQSAKTNAPTRKGKKHRSISKYIQLVY